MLQFTVFSWRQFIIELREYGYQPLLKLELLCFGSELHCDTAGKETLKLPFSFYVSNVTITLQQLIWRSTIKFYLENQPFDKIQMLRHHIARFIYKLKVDIIVCQPRIKIKGFFFLCLFSNNIFPTHFSAIDCFY